MVNNETGASELTPPLNLRTRHLELQRLKSSNLIHWMPPTQGRSTKFTLATAQTKCLWFEEYSSGLPGCGVIPPYGPTRCVQALKCLICGQALKRRPAWPSMHPRILAHKIPHHRQAGRQRSGTPSSHLLSWRPPAILSSVPPGRAQRNLRTPDGPTTAICITGYDGEGNARYEQFLLWARAIHTNGPESL